MKPTKLLAVCLMLCVLFSVFVACENDPVEPESNGKQTSVDEEQTRVEQEQTTAEQGETNAGQEQTTAEQEETNAEQEETTAEQGETNAEQGETDISEVESDENSTSTEEVTVTETETEEETKYELSSIGEFHDGLALVSANTGYGYINTKGEIVIEPCFDKAGDFCNELSIVTKGDTRKYINKAGETVYLFSGSETGFGICSNGYFWIETMEEVISGNVYTMTYYDQLGTKKITISNAKESTYKIPNHNLNAWDEVDVSISSFNKWGYAIVCINDDNKFIDTNGNMVVFDGLDPSYSIEMYCENYVVIDNKVYYIDYVNQTATQMTGGYWNSTYDLNYLPLLNGFYGLYVRYIYDKEYQKIFNDNNEIVFSSISELGGAKVKGISSFTSENETYFVLYLLSSSNVCWSTIVDSNGNVVFSPTNKIHLGYISYYVPNGTLYAYRDYSCYSFSSGLCIARDDETNMYGFIDIDGKWVIEPTFVSACDFYGEGEDAVAVVNNNTIIDRTGKVIYSIGSKAE